MHTGSTTIIWAGPFSFTVVRPLMTRHSGASGAYDSEQRLPQLTIVFDCWGEAGIIDSTGQPTIAMFSE